MNIKNYHHQLVRIINNGFNFLLILRPDQSYYLDKISFLLFKRGAMGLDDYQSTLTPYIRKSPQGSTLDYNMGNLVRGESVLIKSIVKEMGSVGFLAWVSFDFGMTPIFLNAPHYVIMEMSSSYSFDNDNYLAFCLDYNQNTYTDFVGGDLLKTYGPTIRVYGHE